MTLEAEVAALTTATNNLLAAVNIRKAAIDAAAGYADTVNQAFQTQTRTATGNVALAKTDPVYQFINPNGANRDVTLPALTGADTSVAFSVKNTGTGGYTLTVKTAAAAVLGAAIPNGYTLSVVWDGTNWQVL